MMLRGGLRKHSKRMVPQPELDRCFSLPRASSSILSMIGKPLVVIDPHGVARASADRRDVLVHSQCAEASI